MRNSLVFLGAALVVASVTAAACSGNGNTGGAGGGTGGNATTSSTGGPSTTTGTGTGTGTTTSSTGTGMPNPDLDCSPPTGSIPALKLTSVATGLTEAIQVKAAPDDPDRLYVAQKNGIISIIENGQVLGTPFIDLTSVVQDSGEEGLLGLAFHPDYKNNGRFFVHYSKAGNGDNVVMEYKRSAADPHVADPTPVQLVVESTTLEGNHNGGALEFGSDGFLYFSMGDGGQQHDCNCDAQRDTIQGYGPPTDGSLDLLGKISRVDVNGTPDANGYPAAAGNPNGGKAYHRGLRNPWRISFDACTGDLYIGDVGQDTWEEVDVAPVNGGALNFGWPFWEGANDPNDASHHHYATNQCPGNPANAPDCGNEPAATSFTFPIADYHHGAECSITGGYVYRSSAIPALRGTYFYGDYCSGKIWTTSWANGTATTPVLSMITPGNNVLVAFGQDGRGNVYVVDISGTIYRVDAM